MVGFQTSFQRMKINIANPEYKSPATDFCREFTHMPSPCPLPNLATCPDFRTEFLENILRRQPQHNLPHRLIMQYPPLALLRDRMDIPQPPLERILFEYCH